MRRIGEPRADGVLLTPEPIEDGWHARASVICELANVVSDDTEDQSVSEIPANCPLEVESSPVS